ncbi:MAG: hypothetical protein PHS34_09460 [Candidatus Omnitrophica bacterium]|nr:hypothetical protein [Candidatus Omnitrophota bacterium]
MEHTKTPWKYEYEGSGDYAIFGSDNTDIGTAWSKDAHFLGLGGKAEENLANADFIVQACNAYDADQAEIKRLREALEKASMELNFIKFDGRHDSKLCRTKAAQQQMSPCLLCEIEQLLK